jgi:hypothetical protein
VIVGKAKVGNGVYVSLHEVTIRVRRIHEKIKTHSMLSNEDQEAIEASG